MAEFTLLQMVQNVLSRLDSDEVNSISDTTESMQVANIIQNKYYDILARGELPEHTQLFQLTPSGDSTKPTLMYVPAGVSRIDWIKYFDVNPNESQQVDQFGSFQHGLNTDLTTSTSSWSTTSTTSNTVSIGSKTFTVASSTLSTIVGQPVAVSNGSNIMYGTLTSYSSTTMVINVTSVIGSGTLSSWTIAAVLNTVMPGYKYVTILPIDQFLDIINRFNPGDTEVGQYTFTEGGYNFTFYYKNNIQPRYCTVVANNYIIFDGYDQDFDTTLQGSKTLTFGQIVPSFQLTDTFIPAIDDQQFPLLINEATSLAFYELKQSPHLKADQEIKRQWSTIQKNKSLSNKPTYFAQLADFGRVPRTGGYSSGGYGSYRWMRQAGP